MRLALVLTLAASSAWACRYQPTPIATSLKEAPLVFIGRIEKVDKALATFTVEAASKGTSPGASIQVSSDQTSCGLRFGAGERWLILASKNEGAWSTRLPSNSRLLTDDRGLQQPLGWEDVFNGALSPAQLKPLLDGNTCVQARFELMTFFATLPRACAKDSDCSLAYLDTHPCYAPVVVSSGYQKVAEQKSPKLLSLQTKEKAACTIDVKRVPACEAMLRPMRCEARVCVGGERS